MAGRSKPTPTVCFVWNTERPYKDTPRKSDKFLLKGFEWYFKLQYHLPVDGKAVNGSKYFYGISLISLNQKKTEIYLRNQPLFVTSFVEDSKLSERFENSLLKIASVKSNDTRIWHCWELDASQKFTNDCGAWRFICIFHDVTSLEFQPSNETIHLSSQTDVSCLQISSDKCVQASIEIPSDLERLSDDFSHLLEKKIFPDVNLSCAGQVRSVHRSILAARSEVFSAMFQNKMLESETGSVHVKDLEDSVLDMLLKYVYSGKIPDLCDNTAVSLYEAGDKYAMSTLKTACSDWMIRNMTEENCVLFLNVADAHSDDVFKNTVLAFMYEHPTIFKGDVWSAFSEENVKLAKEVLQGYVTSILK